MVDDGGAIIWNLDVDDAKFNAGLDSAEKKATDVAGNVDKTFSSAATNIGKSLESAKKGSQEFATGLGVAGAAAVAFGVSSLSAYQESENVVAQLDAVIKSTAGVMNQQQKTTTTTKLSASETSKLNDELKKASASLADQETRWKNSKTHTETAALSIQKTKDEVAKLTGELNHAGDTISHTFVPPTQLSRQALIDLSGALQQTSTFSDETILSAENLLLTFTNIGKNVFPDATKTVLDMSTALGQDTKSSAIQLGKALQDPIIGVSALRKVGVNFTEDQQKLIKTLVDSGKTMDAQKLILKELNTEFGGSAAAAAKTFSGQLTIVKNNFNDFQELIGKAISERFQPLIKGFNDWMMAMGGPEGMLKKFNDEILPRFISGLPILIGLIAGGLTPAIWDLAASFIAAAAPLIPFIAAGVALGVVAKLIIDALGGWEATQKKINESLKFMGDIYNQYLKPAVDDLWKNITTNLIPALSNLWTAISPILIPTLKILGIILGATIVGAFRLVISIINQSVTAITSISKAITILIGFYKGLFDNVISLIKYFKEANKTGDYMNDWLTHLPKSIQPAVESIGKISTTLTFLPKYIKEVVKSGDYLNDWLTYIPKSFQGFIETIGKVITTLQNFPKYITEVVTSGDYMNDWLSNIPKSFQSAIMGIGQFIVKLQDTAKFVGTVFAELPGQLAGYFAALPERIAYQLGFALATIIKWGTDTFNYLTTNIPIWINSVGTWFSQLPGTIKTWLDAVITGFVAWGISTGDFLKNTITTWITNAGIWLSALPGVITTWLTETYNRFVKWGADTLELVKNNATNWINNLISMVQQIPGKIFSALSDLGNQMRNSFSGSFNTAQNEVNNWPSKILQWGRNVGDAFVNGVKGGLNNLKDAFTNGFNNARGSIEGHSPPKEGPLKDIDKWGFNIGNAWVQGMQSAIGQFSLPQVGGGSLGSMSSAPSLGEMSSGSGAKGGQQVTVNIGTVENQSDIDSLIHELGFRAMLAPEISL